MIHEILPVGMLACNCSVIGDEVTRDAIVIDPGDDIAEIVAILDRHLLHVKMIVIAHAHIDHIGGAAKLRALTGAPVYMNEADTCWPRTSPCRRRGWAWRHRRIRASTRPRRRAMF